MKSKLKIIVLAFCAFFLASANFFSQDNSTKQETQSRQNQDSIAQKQNEEPAASDSQNEEDEDAPDVYDDGEEFVYLQNAPGDQFINIRVMPSIPLNFDDKLKVGGQITVSYNRFLTTWLAVGAELAFGYNPTIGSNIFTYIPMTVGVTFLPAIKKFEFPITLNVGMAVENYLSNTFFPAFVLRCGAGAYYRINESWSAGIEGFFSYMPQWYFKEPEKNDYLNMASVSAGVKYHF
ncbi:MAG: porin family protein [Treponema sp.]|nr:porin family protein [Treponema sp.]